MPKEWKKGIIAGGPRFEQLSFAEVVTNFCDMEDISRNVPPSELKASERPAEDVLGRKSSSSKAKKRKFRPRGKNNKAGNIGRKTIADAYQCPLNPQGNHTWDSVVHAPSCQAQRYWRRQR
jgi:hypothetical protein